jgi:hypothetical protein
VGTAARPPLQGAKQAPGTSAKASRQTGTAPLLILGLQVDEVSADLFHESTLTQTTVQRNTHQAKMPENSADQRLAFRSGSLRHPEKHDYVVPKSGPKHARNCCSRLMISSLETPTIGGIVTFVLTPSPAPMALSFYAYLDADATLLAPDRLGCHLPFGPP